MNDILKYTEDKNFIRWVHYPDKELNSYWEAYLKNNPDEKQEIENARNIVLQLKSKKEEYSEEEADELFSSIMEGIGQVNNSTVRNRSISVSILKYAAIFLFAVLAIGGLYLLNNRDDFEFASGDFQVNSTDISGNSELILSDGQVISLTEKNNYIEFTDSKQVIVNKTDSFRISNENQKVFSQVKIYRGKNSVLKMDDGTIIYLNAGSNLIFPESLKNNKRSVYLNGEGFFEVAHNPESPFVVGTENIAVEVLGTKFNLSAYTSEKLVETYLQEGSVQVRKLGGLKSNKGNVLKPLQNALFNKDSKEVLVSDIDDKEYISWYKGYINLRSDNIAGIIKKLERYFDVSIEYDAQEIKSSSISGKLKIDDEKIETVLQVLANATSLDLVKLDGARFILK